MIVDVRKYLIYGAKDDMDRFFILAQRAGFIEFIGIWHKKALQLPSDTKNILSAIKILRRWSGLEEELALAVPADVASLAERVVHLNATIERLQEEERVLEANLMRIAPLGNFSMSDVHAIEKEGKRILQFFCMKSDLVHEIALPPEMIYISTDYDLDYFVAINKEKAHYPKMIEIHIDQPAGELRAYLDDVRAKIAAFGAELKSYATSLGALQQGLAESLDEHDLRLAKHDASFPVGEALFAIEAWVPKTKIKQFEELLGSVGISSEEISIDPSDRVPTCLENAGNAKIGEDLVRFYDTPAITDKDPSRWVLFFFAMFFAMIISDAGYGILFLAVWGFLKWKKPAILAEQKRFQTLIGILAAASIGWGILVGSYFGIDIDPSNPIRKVCLLDKVAEKKADYILSERGADYESYKKQFPQIADAKDGKDFLMKGTKEQDGKKKYVALDELNRGILLEFSLVVGMVHISLAFLRYAGRKWSGLGWVIAIIGGYLYFPKVVGATPLPVVLGLVSKNASVQIGMYLILFGIGFAIVAAAVQKGILAALREPLQGLEVFNDVLSYLRLYALGLAGMIIADTVNSMAASIGLFFGVFILIAGHALNLGISLMGGVIHGLRLNFLEWYRHCFEGEGKEFNPLRIRKPKP